MAGEFLSRLMPKMGGGGMIDLIVSILLGSTALLLCGGFLWWFFKKRKSWNIKVEFRLPRHVQEIGYDDGSKRIIGTIKKEWGKGYYNANEGIVYLKRKGVKPTAMKPFNVKEFLSDNNILTVIQVGIEDYRPVLEDSYLEVTDLKSGNPSVLLDVKIDTSESKAWKNSYERERKATFTISSFLREHGQLLGFGFILICVFVGFAIVLGKIK